MKNIDNNLNQKAKRETFSSGLTAFFATLGSAVGLGNIWKFPYLVGINGGGAFVLIYIFCVFLIGIPVMLAEFYIGRKTRSNPVGAFKQLKPSSPWKLVGYMNVLTAFFITFFYSSVAGWVYSYIFRIIKGDFLKLPNLGIEDATSLVQNNFDKTVSGQLSPIIWQGLVLLVVSLILIAGVKNGIEKITKTLMPLLFSLIIIICIRGLFLSGAGEGLNFLFKPNFSKITPTVILTALGLAFFKLSVGMGTMVVYSSYFTDDNNLINTARRVALSDTLVSLLAGVAIFPVVFSFGLEADSGPGLLFNTIPLVFSKLPFGNILLLAFFLLTAFAATTAMISLIEVPVVFISEELKVKRSLAVIISSLIIFIVGIFTVHPASYLGGVKLFNKNFFDLFDYMSSNIMMPIGGLSVIILVGYMVSKNDFKRELSNNGSLKNEKIINSLIFLMRYITPLLLLIVFLNSIGLI